MQVSPELTAPVRMGRVESGLLMPKQEAVQRSWEPYDSLVIVRKLFLKLVLSLTGGVPVLILPTHKMHTTPVS